MEKAWPEIWTIGFEKHYDFVVSGYLLVALEKLSKAMIFTIYRTHIRIRSPRLAASSLKKNVGKGSRQN